MVFRVPCKRSSDELAMLISGLLAWLSMMVAEIGSLNGPVNVLSVMLTILVGLMCAVMASFWVSITFAHGSWLVFVRMSTVIAVVFTVFMLLVGAAGWGVFLTVLVMFLLFGVGEFLCMR